MLSNIKSLSAACGTDDSDNLAHFCNGVIAVAKAAKTHKLCFYAIPTAKVAGGIKLAVARVEREPVNLLNGVDSIKHYIKCLQSELRFLDTGETNLLADQLDQIVG